MAILEVCALKASCLLACKALALKMAVFISLQWRGVYRCPGTSVP